MDPEFFTVIIQSVYTSDNKENSIRLPRCTINEVIMLIETVLLKNSELMMRIYRYDEDDED